MDHDIDTKKVRINCFRQPKMVEEFMLQMRMPGAVIEARHLPMVRELCERYGNGTFHMDTRQTLDTPRIKYENIEAVNKFLKGYIHDVDVEMCDVDMEVNNYDYPITGVRNVMSCTGNAHCTKGDIDTYELARKIEKIIFPSYCRIKVVVAGCPNDCVKASSNDFDIMGVNKQDCDIDQCIGCGSYVGACKHHATGVPSLNRDDKVNKDACCCVGYGECSLVCSIGAWTRGIKKPYRVTLRGRTGKQNPRARKLFPNWVTKDVILDMFFNWQKFFVWALDYKPEYLHGGYLIDRVGYREFVKHIFEDVEFSSEAKMADDIFRAENEQRGNMHVMPSSEHKHAGPQEKK